MNFKFKLSKRLAILKAALAGSVVLALACESTRATGPNAPNTSPAFDLGTSCLSSTGAWQNDSFPSQTGPFEAQFDVTPSQANMAGVVGLSTGVGSATACNLTITAWTPPLSLTSAGAWQNGSFLSQTGSFEAQFDVTPRQANMAGVVGLSNGPAAAYTDLAGIVAFEQTGVIEARNGGAYAAAATIPYSAGTTYHFRLDVNLPAHTYDVYVTPAGAPEQRVGSNFAFRTEQAAVSVLNNLGLYANLGSATVRNLTLAAWTPPPPAPVASVTVSPAAASVSVGATMQLRATLRDASGKPLAGRSVTWASSTLGMASVSTGGFVTGVAVGPVTITATSEGQSGHATVTVNQVVGNPVAGPTPLYTLGNGANYYVAPSGSDANPCSTTAPCYTMQRVSQVMSPGDNAHFAA